MPAMLHIHSTESHREPEAAMPVSSVIVGMVIAEDDSHAVEASKRAVNTLHSALLEYNPALGARSRQCRAVAPSRGGGGGGGGAAMPQAPTKRHQPTANPRLGTGERGKRMCHDVDAVGELF